MFISAATAGRGEAPTTPTNLRITATTATSIDGVLGDDETVTYCRAPGPTEIVLKAVDTSGNVSAPSNALHFDC